MVWMGWSCGWWAAVVGESMSENGGVEGRERGRGEVQASGYCWAEASTEVRVFFILNGYS